MNRICPKCGAANTLATGATDEACPSCGVIYSKAASSAPVRSPAPRSQPTLPPREQDRPKSIVERIAWVLAVVGAGVGVAVLIFTEFHAESAPQQAAGAGMALAYAAIPYCLARAIQLGSRKS